MKNIRNIIVNIYWEKCRSKMYETIMEGNPRPAGMYYNPVINTANKKVWNGVTDQIKRIEYRYE